MVSRRSAGMLAFGLFFPIVQVNAAPSWSACAAETNATTRSNSPLRPPDLAAQAIYVEADQALFREQGFSDLQGDVVIAQNDATLQAKIARFDRNNGEIEARGQVRLQTPQLQVDSRELVYNLQSRTGRIEDVAYLLRDAEGRGQSKRLIQNDAQRIRLEDASYTTCPPGVNTWSFHAGNIQLDRQTEEGVARDVTFRVGNTPLLYLPYFSFPLSDQRKSGFLTPTMGTDEQNGFKLSVPYYFNLAPNYDLTLTTSFLSKRGLQAESAFRYLFNQHRGDVEYTVLPSDRDYNNELRYAFDWEHYSQMTSNSRLTLNAAGVSDIDYFSDLSSSLEASSTVNLERSLRYTHEQKPWTFTALAQSYQVLDNEAEVFARLPQLLAQWQPSTAPNELQLQARGEYTYFSNSSATDGHRFDIQAGVSQKFANDYAYIKPTLKAQYTRYQLQGEDETTTLNRSLPSASVEAGLFFERDLDNGRKIQTLEPRLYYTFTPYQDQSAIPIFDAARVTPSYNSLFSDNRFVGIDRVADSNRLSTSLTTRLQNVEKGREVLRASVGQIYYFDKRKVTLPDDSIDTDTRSEIVFDMAGQLNAATQINGTAFFDTRKGDILANQLKINYKDDKERVLNIGFGQRKHDYQAAHISFASPIRDNWTIVGAYERDLENGRLLETLGGFEYQSCCWRGRLVTRKSLLSDNKTYDDAIFAEFELKGLGNFGSSTRNLLESRIYGYE